MLYSLVYQRTYLRCHFAGRGLRNEIRQVKCVKKTIRYSVSVSDLLDTLVVVALNVNQWAHKQEIMKPVFRFGGGVRWAGADESTWFSPRSGSSVAGLPLS